MIVNDFKIYCLKRNYLQIYELLTKFQSHTYDIFKRYFITTTDKNVFINQIYELSKSINISYNSIILDYSEPEFNCQYMDLIKKYEGNFNELYELIESKYIKEGIPSPIPRDILHPINDHFDDSLDDLVCLIGFPSIEEFVKFNQINIEIPKLINSHFKILKIFQVDSIQITLEDKKIIKDSYGLMNDKLFFRINSTQPQEIILPYFDLVINTHDSKYICQGVFYDDYLNLSSRIMTQVSFPKLFEKKKEISNMFSIRGSDDEINFKSKYIKYCDIGEIIVLMLFNIFFLNHFRFREQQTDV
jgi:hypothetical protein